MNRATFLADRWGWLVLVVVAPLVLFWRLVFAGQVLYWGVPLMQFYPWHTLVNQALSAGHWPLWTDLLGNGAPLLANLQTAVFYPPNLLFRALPVERAMGYSVVLHCIGAGLAAYYWGATLGLDRPGRTVTALSYALGGYAVGRTQFITMVAAYAWLPLLLALTDRLVRNRRLLNCVWLGGALALQFLAGHAQIWFYSLVLVGAYGAFRTIQCARGQRSSLTPQPLLPVGEGGRGDEGASGAPLPNSSRIKAAVLTLASLGLAVVLSLGLSGIQLLPTAELALNSQRGTGAGWDFATTYSFWPWRVLTLAAPDLFGNPADGSYVGYGNYWEDTAYPGVLTLLLAVSAALSWVTRRARPASTRAAGSPAAASSVVPFFTLLVPLAVLLAMGKNTPAFRLVFEYVPGFGIFQAPARLMLWFAIGVSTLAGIGAHHFRLRYWGQYALRLIAAGALAMLGVGLAAGAAGLPYAVTAAPAVSRLAIMLAVAGAILLLRGREPGEPDGRVARSPLPRPAWEWMVASLVCVDLVAFGVRLTPSLPPEVYRPPGGFSPIEGAWQPDTRLYVDPAYEYAALFKRYFTFKSFGPQDVAYWQELRASGLANLNAVDGIPAVNNYDPLVIGRWQDLMDTLATADWPVRQRLLRIMNVGYVLSEAADLDPVPGVPDGYRLADPLPRAWVVTRARVLAPHAGGLAGPSQVLSELAAPDFEPGAEVLLEGTSDTPAFYPAAHRREPAVLKTARGRPAPALKAGAGPGVTLHEDWNSRTIDAILSQPGYLVLAYTYYPGWQATMDGQAVPILRADYAFMAVPLPAGQHRVELTYHPAALGWGGIISGVSILAALGMAIACLRGRANRVKLTA